MEAWPEVGYVGKGGIMASSADNTVSNAASRIVCFFNLEIRLIELEPFFPSCNKISHSCFQTYLPVFSAVVEMSNSSFLIKKLKI